MLKVQSAAPAASLRACIRGYVQREAYLGSQELVEPVVARLGVMLEFEFAGAYEVRNYGSNALDDTFPISIIGPQTWRRARLLIRNHVESLVVLFQPAGFHALFGIPTLPLAETGTEGHAVLGPSVSHLHQHLGNQRTFAERVGILDLYFQQRLGSHQVESVVHRALHVLTQPGPFTQVSEIARHMKVSQRQLERKALEYTGVSPKALTRIARFSRALRLRAESPLTWTQIAHASDYHDHMHMIRDLRIFAGEAPTSAVQEIAPDHLIHYCAS
jgi:AraC-like DNA-binding protein